MPGTERVEITGPNGDRFDEILTPQAIDLIATLHAELGPRRQELLAARRRRQAEFSRGAMLDFLPETEHIRSDPNWRVAPPAPGLLDRRVEITGPTERKMMINALNSGANVFMADFEDANTPPWENMIGGQLNLKDALDRTIEFRTAEGREYALGPTTGWPRSWSGRAAGTCTRSTSWSTAQPVSGSLFDFGALLLPQRAEAARQGQAARTSTCPRWRATSRRGCGTTSSTSPRTRWASRAARSAPRC